MRCVGDTMVDIHNYAHRLELAWKYLETYPITQRNKDLIRQYVDEKMLGGVSMARQCKLIEILRQSAKAFGKDFEACTIEDIRPWAMQIEQKDYTINTKTTHRIIIKTFYKWLRKTETYPPEVKWLNTTIKRREKKMISDQDLITSEEILAAIEAAQHPRDKALIAVLAESGARIGEIGNLQLKHVKFDEHGTILNIYGKTGSRRIRIVSATRHLVTWINIHPGRKNIESALWARKRNDRRAMGYNGIKSVLLRTFKHAGLKKRLYPHLFRHSRASYMARHMTEFQMNQYFGWVQGSTMPSTYVHMSGKDMDTAILRMNGYTIKGERNEDELRARICPRCEEANTPNSVYCHKCSATLDQKQIIEEQKELMKTEQKENSINSLMSELLKDSEVAELLIKKIEELKLEKALDVV